MKVAAVIVAAGTGHRFGGSIPKQFLQVAGRPLLSWTISRFENADSIDNIVVVVAEEHLLFVSEQIVQPYEFRKVTKILPGGATRQESVLAGLTALPLSTNFVAIHDGARPLVTPDDIDRVVSRASVDRAAILASPVPDTVKRVKDRHVLATLDRRLLYLAQTPQVFQYDLILSAHQKAQGDAAIDYTDDAMLIEASGFKVTVVEPTSHNLKVTTQSDLALVAGLLEAQRE